VLHKESQNIFKQIEAERQEFYLEGDCGLSPEEAWRWKSLGIIPHWDRDTNIVTWEVSKNVKVETLEDLKNIHKQFSDEEIYGECCPDA